MPLNLSSGGSISARLKFDAKGGRFTAQKDKNDYIIEKPVFVADFRNIKTGWAYFVSNGAPDIRFDPSLENMAAQPSSDHKRYFSLPVFVKSSAIETVADFGSASAIVGGAISDLFDQYLQESGANAGKLPVIQVKGIEPIKGNYGTNYKPTMVIAKWVEIPAEFSGGGSAASEPLIEESADAEEETYF